MSQIYPGLRRSNSGPAFTDRGRGDFRKSRESVVGKRNKVRKAARDAARAGKRGRTAGKYYRGAKAAKASAQVAKGVATLRYARLSNPWGIASTIAEYLLEQWLGQPQTGNGEYDLTGWTQYYPSPGGPCGSIGGMNAYTAPRPCGNQGTQFTEVWTTGQEVLDWNVDGTIAYAKFYTGTPNIGTTYTTYYVSALYSKASSPPYTQSKPKRGLSVAFKPLNDAGLVWQLGLAQSINPEIFPPGVAVQPQPLPWRDVPNRPVDEYNQGNYNAGNVVPGVQVGVANPPPGTLPYIAPPITIGPVDVIADIEAEKESPARPARGTDKHYHKRAKPRQHEKERKAQMSPKMAKIMRAISEVSEAVEITHALYNALSYDNKLKYWYEGWHLEWQKLPNGKWKKHWYWGWKESKYLKRKVTGKEALQALYNHWDEINIEVALYNIFTNQLEDIFYGALGQRQGQRAKELGYGYGQAFNSILRIANSDLRGIQESIPYLENEVFEIPSLSAREFYDYLSQYNS